jgi:hypothetical protein
VTAEPSSDVALILDGLATVGRMPRDALADAVARWDQCIPVFIDMIERRPDQSEVAQEADDALFLIIHLCGQMRETRAYRPLLRLVTGKQEMIAELLGDAVGQMLARVVAAVFDGDVRPLHHAILTEAADEFVRAALLDALARVTRDGRVARAETEAFLRRCGTELRPREACFAWHGWQKAIAHLGLHELKNLVKAAFDDGRIDEVWLDYEDFEEDLTNSDGDAWPDEPFGNVAEEFAGWPLWQPRDQTNVADDELELPTSYSIGAPVKNPFRNVGRNDPCPCGSGKKYKACCLA